MKNTRGIRLGTVIAERALDGPDANVRVRIGKPRRVAGSAEYYCPYVISGIGTEGVRCAIGEDTTQALLLALKMIGSDLYCSEEYQSGTLTWNAAKDLGFPLPESIRDLKPK